MRYANGLEVPFAESSGTFTPPAGVHDSLVHNSNGTWTLTTKRLSVLGFNSTGRLVSVADRAGNTVTVTRDSSDKPASVSDGLGRSLTFGYSGGLMTSVTDPTGRVWTFAYDSSNNLASITYPALGGSSYSRSFTYNANSDMVSETDRRGKTWTFSYDSGERLTSFTNPLNKTWTWAFTTTAATLTGPDGKTTVHNYSGGLIASAVDEAGYSTAYTYDSAKNVVTVTDKRGKVWTSTYDAHGNRLTAKDPLQNTWTNTYNSSHDQLTATDPLGNTSSATYNSVGKVLTVTDPLGRTVATATYNSYGEPVTGADALGRTSSVAYDSYGNTVQGTDPAGVVTSTSFDLLGRPVSVTDASGATTAIAYDAWGRVTSVTEPGSAVSSLTYDAEGHVLSATDPIGRTGSRTYDDLGRPVVSTNGKGETETLGYNDRSWVVSVTNGRGYARTYSHSFRGEVTSLTMPDGAVDQWSHNGNGDRTGYTNPLGQTVGYVYDNAGQVTTVDYPAGTDTSLTYDSAGRQTQMVDGSGTTTWTYNAADELTGFSSPQGTIAYTYNGAGQRASMVQAGTGTTTYAYDAAGRQASVTDIFGTVTSFSYDSAGRPSRRTLGNGNTEDIGYDSRSRMNSVTLKNSGGTVLSTKAYTFNAVSQVTQLVEGSVTTTYGYDNAGQLASESKTGGYSAGYTYDANGNRLTRTVGGATESYSYDQGDKLLSVSGGSDPRTFGYDAAGRTTSIVRASGTTSLAYDYESRLTSVTKPGATTDTFSYNGLDTRVGLTDSSGTKSFRRDGAGATAPVLSDGAALYTPGVSEWRAGTKTFFHHGLKSTDAQSGATGALSATRSYDAFGNLLGSTGTWKSPFGYAGGFGYQEDPDHGFRLLGHRYYDSSTGRFLTRDPAKDGRNWYAYCAGDPVNRVDVDGFRPAWLYKLVNNADELLKWGKTVNPVANKANRWRARYTDQWLTSKGAKFKPVQEFPDEASCLAAERELVMNDPGPWNKEPWAGKGRPLGLAIPPLGMASSKPMLNEYNDTIDKTAKQDWGVWEWCPYVGDVIAAFKELGNAINSLGKDVREARYDAGERALEGT